MKFLEIDPVTGKTVQMHIRPNNVPTHLELPNGNLMVPTDELVPKRLVDGELVPDIPEPKPVPERKALPNPYVGMTPEQVTGRVNSLTTLPALREEVKRLALLVAALSERT